MTPDSHIKQHINLFRSAEGGLEDFRLVMNNYNHKESLSPIENFHLYILCMLCNACSIIKNYCLCDQRWEEVFITGNIYILINESIKKIIGFKSKNGTRKQSLCDIISMELNDAQMAEFNSIKNEFINFADDENLQKTILNERNTAVHFDDDLNALNLFRFQSKRDARLSFNLFIIWFYLMNALNAFISKHLNNGTEQDK